METKAAFCPTILEVLDKNNYMNWSIRVKTYLMAQDLLETIEVTTDPLEQEDNIEVASGPWSKKNTIALHVIQNSCGPDAFSQIWEITSAKIAWYILEEKYNVIEVHLDKDNYIEWNARVKHYLIAKNLWDIVETTTEPPQQKDDEATFKAWSKRNLMALCAIQNSCQSETFSKIKDISFAKIAWDTLAIMYDVPKTTSSVTRYVLQETNYDEWSARIKTYLMAHDLWHIIDATTSEPPNQEDDEVALQVIQNSCGSDIIFNSMKISSAKIAWNTLAEKYNTPTNVDSDSFGEYAILCKAVRSGDWNTVKVFLERRPDTVTAKITQSGETALHIAVVAGHTHIVEELVELMSEEDLEILNRLGDTALVEAAIRGKCKMAECMLSKNKNLISFESSAQYIPVVTAICNGQIETTHYLYSLTPLEDLKPNKGCNGANLFTEAIYTGELDIALDLMERCPRLAFSRDFDGVSPLEALASVPHSFPSGTRLVFWKRWIYCCIHIQSARATNETRLSINPNVERHQIADHEGRTVRSASTGLLRHLVSHVLSFLGIQHLYEMKMIHVQTQELLRSICEEIQNLDIKRRTDGGVYNTLVQSIENGIFEIFFEMLRANPDLVWTDDGEKRNIFLLPVLHRQAKIFSLIYGLDLKNSLTCCRGQDGSGMLHMVGMSATSTMLDHISGAALQMQRELQWFKEVESVVHPKVKEARNHDGLSPRELFTKNHKDMVEKGERWMKDTATSCTVVGALIVTIMFAVAFSVPGGNNEDTGYPMFSSDKLFWLFIISDALSLFSSSTSVLMFLGILTSRYAEDDFLESLPRKMIIGLSTLFISIAAMMVAFTATLAIMLRGHRWIIHPVIGLASIPVTLFVLLQFPLLVQMFISTYRPHIFDRKMKPLF